MTQLKRQLSLLDGINLAVGSIIGSGILFLPSVTYGIAKEDVLLVWILATLLCLPLLKIFSDIVAAVPSARGVEGFVSLGLGESVGASVPLLFLFCVCTGIPAAAIVAGQYVEQIFPHPLTSFICAFLIISIAMGVNLAGAKLGSKINTLVTLFTIGVAITLIGLTLPEATKGYSNLYPAFKLGPILSGTTMAFWAYSGFENLSFIASEFKNPKRDFPVAAIVALLMSGVLYFLLTANYAAIMSFHPHHSLTALAQLSSAVPSAPILTPIVTLFAVLVVLLNLISWTWGISRMSYSSAVQGNLPKFLGYVSDKGIPTRAVWFLGLSSIFVLGISRLQPDLLERGLTIISSVLVFIYFLCLLSYFRFIQSPFKKWISFIMAVGFLVGVINTGWIAIYPIATVAIRYFLDSKKIRKRIRLVEG